MLGGEGEFSRKFGMKFKKFFLKMLKEFANLNEENRNLLFCSRYFVDENCEVEELVAGRLRTLNLRNTKTLFDGEILDVLVAENHRYISLENYIVKVFLWTVDDPISDCEAELTLVDKNARGISMTHENIFYAVRSSVGFSNIPMMRNLKSFCPFSLDKIYGPCTFCVLKKDDKFIIIVGEIHAVSDHNYPGPTFAEWIRALNQKGLDFDLLCEIPVVTGKENWKNYRFENMNDKSSDGILHQLEYYMIKSKISEGKNEYSTNVKGVDARCFLDFSRSKREGPLSILDPYVAIYDLARDVNCAEWMDDYDDEKICEFNLGIDTSEENKQYVLDFINETTDAIKEECILRGEKFERVTVRMEFFHLLWKLLDEAEEKSPYKRKEIFDEMYYSEPLVINMDVYSIMKLLSYDSKPLQIYYAGDAHSQNIIRFLLSHAGFKFITSASNRGECNYISPDKKFYQILNKFRKAQNI
jgi:hypothetical protein